MQERRGSIIGGIKVKGDTDKENEGRNQLRIGNVNFKMTVSNPRKEEGGRGDRAGMIKGFCIPVILITVPQDRYE